ncbi:uncharacterized protein LOC143445487 [Clavelina lepadiformis]|uniref:G-protein coupled receptors family 1 profile domain-containing protein n=1 Tax=Clavelina lepadiformis TaxID=159417 RepID=A0ABP0GT08_CLALP
MLFWDVLVVLLFVFVIASAQTQALNDSVIYQSSSDETRTNSTREDRLCVFLHGFRLNSKEREIECCQQTVKNYEIGGIQHGMPLTNYLETLRGWNCPQFSEECERKLFAFTPFTEMVYEYFCSYDNYVNQCMPDVKKIVEAAEQRSANMKISTGPSTTPFQGILDNAGNDANNSSGNQQQWNGFINKIPTIHFSLDELLDPCLQVAQYEAEGDHRGNFHEVMSIAIPFCDLRWQGFTGEYLLEYRVSRWTTFSTKCRVNIGIIVTVSAILAVTITFVNIIVIIVILRLSSDEQNSQTIYRLSLAIADLLVGVIVIPTCANTLATFSLSMFDPGGVQLLQGLNYHRNASTYVNLTGRAGKLINLFPTGYNHFVGFFTTVSLFVSVYTLAGAGFDRLIAVYRPLRYQKHKAKKVALLGSIFAWFLAAMFAILPIFVPSLSNSLVLYYFITTGGPLAFVLLPVAFAIPLIVVWVVSIATYKATTKHSKFRRKLSQSARNGTRRIEARLARTLVLMVGFFSFSVVPMFVLLLVPSFFPALLFYLPRQLNLNAATIFLNFQLVAAILFLCNSLWNFFIYNYRNLNFRNDVKHIFKVALKKTGITSCSDSTILCFQRMAYHGRRRLSSLPTLSYYTTRKKSSTTETTKDFTGIDLTASQLPSVFSSTSQPENTVEVSATTNTSRTSATINHTTDVTCLQTDTKTSKNKSKNTKNQKHEKQNKNVDGSMVSEDSIFKSMVIDVNADRLFLSVMENIDEEIVPNESYAKNQEKK